MNAELRKVHTHLLCAIFELKELQLSENVQYRNSAKTIIGHIDKLAKQILGLMEMLENR